MANINSPDSLKQIQRPPNVSLAGLICVFLFVFPVIAFAQPTVNVTLNEGSLTEANLETGRFTVTRSNDGNTSEALTVYFTFAGNATNGTDYTTTNQNYVNANTRWISIPANQLSATSDVTPLKDNFIEGVENAVFTLQTDSGYTLGSEAEVEMTI